MSRAFALLAAVAVLAAGAEAAAKRKKSGAKGILEVTASVKGADVIVDGKKLGATPSGPLSVATGVRTVVVKKLGFLDYSEKVKVGAGETSKVIADLLPFAGVIVVTANVKGARVLVDGKAVGMTPLEHEVSLGQRTITVTAPGHKAYTTEVRADAGASYPIEAKLQKGTDAGEGDDLELAPLVALEPAPPAVAKKPAPAGDDNDLELAPLVALEPPPSDAEDDAGLELAPLPDLAAPPALAAVQPTPTGVGTTVEPVKPWYLEWWALGAGAAIVVGGVTTAVLLTRGDEEERLPDLQFKDDVFGNYQEE